MPSGDQHKETTMNAQHQDADAGAGQETPVMPRGDAEAREKELVGVSTAESMESVATAPSHAQPTEEEVVAIPLASLLDENREFRVIGVRRELNPCVVHAYAAAMERGEEFEESVVDEVTDRDGMAFSMAGADVVKASSTDDEDGVEIPISSLLDESVESEEVADTVRRVDVRGALDRERVDAYKLALKRGAKLGPILVVEIDGMRYVASGWHRTVAHAESGKRTIPGRIRPSTWAEAVEVAIEENSRHGHSPTAADVAKSLQLLWQHFPDRLHWSNVRLAEVCGVSEKQVRAAEAFLPPALLEARGKKRTVVRNGKAYDLTPVSSTKNEDGWVASGPAPAAGSARERARAMSTALKYAEQALAALYAVGLNGLRDDVVDEFAFGVKPAVLAAKAGTAEEFVTWLAAAAKALRRKAA